MGAEDEGSLKVLRDRLDACERRRARLYGRLQDAREQIARLEQELEDCLSDAGEHALRLTTDDCVDTGDFPSGAPA